MVMWTGHMDSGDSISFFDILYGSLPFSLLAFQAFGNAFCCVTRRRRFMYLGRRISLHPFFFSLQSFQEAEQRRLYNILS